MSTQTLTVHYLPQFVREADLAGATVVVIDLLRASTTICHALAAGARAVRPYLHVDDVARAAEGEDRSRTLLSGERGCLPIEGFDLGNSPAEYTPEVVFGCEILFTTTNGTVALNHARLAKRIAVGAVVNLSAVAQCLCTEPDVHLLCAGTNGHVTREDQLGAGAIAHELLVRNPRRETNDQAQSVLGEWQELLTTARAMGRTPADQLAIELRATQGGKNLIAQGLDDDLPRCAAIDTLDLVPEFDPQTGYITAS